GAAEAAMPRQQKTRHRRRAFCRSWQPRMDSNHRMPESESGALPLGDGAMKLDCSAGGGLRRTHRLTLGELRGAAGLVQADLLALDLAGIAGHQPGLAQLGLQGLVVLDQRTGDAQANRAGLAGGATALDRDLDVELVGRLGQLQRLAHDHARGLAAEEVLDRAIVDGDVAAALAQENARGGRLATAGAVILSGCHDFPLDLERLRLLGGVRMFGSMRLAAISITRSAWRSSAWARFSDFRLPT